MTTRPEIDTTAARGLKDAGLTWREVGIALAKQAGRPTPFQAQSTANAVYDAERVPVTKPESLWIPCTELWT